MLSNFKYFWKRKRKLNAYCGSLIKRENIWACCWVMLHSPKQETRDRNYTQIENLKVLNIGIVSITLIDKNIITLSSVIQL
jgi:hypothetical protein